MENQRRFSVNRAAFLENRGRVSVIRREITMKRRRAADPESVRALFFPDTRHKPRLDRRNQDALHKQVCLFLDKENPLLLRNDP